MKRSFSGDQETRNMAHSCREHWAFSLKRNEACSLLINGVICEKPPWRIKRCISSKQKGSWTGNFQMYSWENFHAIRGFMTEQLWKLSNLSSKKLGEFLPKK